MVAKEEHENEETTAESRSSVSDTSDSTHNRNSIQMIEKKVSYNDRQYSTRQMATKRSMKQGTKTRRSSFSPSKKTATGSKNTGRRIGSTVFMELPVRESGSTQSSYSHRTWLTTTTQTLPRVARTISTKMSGTTKSSIFEPTRSLGARQRLPNINVKIPHSIAPSPISNTITSTGLRLPYYATRSKLSSSNMASRSEIQMKNMKLRGAVQPMSSRSGDSEIFNARIKPGSTRPKTPKKITTTLLGAIGDPPNTRDETIADEKITVATGGKKGDKKKSKNKKKPSKSSTTESDVSDAIGKGSKKSRNSKGIKGKGKNVKKEKKLNRKIIYKDLKTTEKKLEEEAKNRKKMEWEKNKLFFYWNCVVTRLLDLQRRNHGLKKKEASLKMEKKDGMFHQNWKNMNLARLQREECLDQKRAEFRLMIRELRDSHKRQTDWLFKGIQTYVKDTYSVGEKYINDVVGIRMEYTKGLTDTMFEARENLRVLEIEQNTKYGPALEEFEETMRKLRSKIPTERQERLQKMLVESNELLIELVNVYTTILHHNFIDVCHTANLINELKGVERRLEREMNDMVKKHEKIKKRTEYLHERISNLRRQVNSGKEARKKLHRVMRDQETLQNKTDLAYISKEMTYQENSRLTKALQETSERVDKWYFKVKRDFMKDIILRAAAFEERASQLMNYNHLVKYLFNLESDFLETIENFKDHEEFDDQQEGLKVLLGVYRPHTLYDLEREFEGCTESFTTAIIFFKRRLQQHYMSLDDLHFFIKRRHPLSYLNRVRKEESELKRLLTLTLGSRYAVHNKNQDRPSTLTQMSSQDFRW